VHLDFDLLSLDLQELERYFQVTGTLNSLEMTLVFSEIHREKSIEHPAVSSFLVEI